jgi:esterase/lipase superfamily enzyme
MGARVLASALKELALAGGHPDSAVFTQLVLTAPDIDPDVFRDFAERFRGLASRVTLYASSEDIALKASRKFHSTPRAGESGERLVLLPGVDTIDVTAVDTSLLGHSYFADNTSVLADLHYLLVEGMPPQSRHSLRSAMRNGATYWVFQP